MAMQHSSSCWMIQDFAKGQCMQGLVPAIPCWSHCRGAALPRVRALCLAMEEGPATVQSAPCGQSCGAASEGQLLPVPLRSQPAPQ